MAFIDWFAGDLITGTRLAYGAFYRATDVADLKSVSSSDLKNNAICFVPEYGIYQYDSTDTNDESLPYRITADTGAWNLKFVDVNSTYSSAGGAGGSAGVDDKENGDLIFRKILRTSVYLTISSGGVALTQMPVDGIMPGDFITVSPVINGTAYYFNNYLFCNGMCVEPGSLHLSFFSPSSGYSNYATQLIIKIERYL